MRGCCSRVRSASTPPFAARTTSAPSDGSPVSVAVPDLGIRAEGHRQQVRLERDVGLAAGVGDLPGRRVAGAGDRVAPPDDGHLDGGHLVHRQGAGLVGVERRGRPEGLDRAELLHDGARRREHLGTLGQDGRVDRRERRRDGRDHERDRGQEQLLERHAAGDAQDERRREREGGEDQDLARQPVDLLRQRRLLGRGRLEHPADVADLRVHAGRDDEDRAEHRG